MTKKIISIDTIKKVLEENHFECSYLRCNNINISGYSSLDNIKNDSLIWIRDVQRFDRSKLRNKQNLCIVCNENELLSEYACIFTNNPKAVFFSLLDKFFADDYNTNTENYAETLLFQGGKNCLIGSNCFISRQTIMGDNVTIGNNVSIEGNVMIGDNVTIASGCVIGKSGFGYYIDPDGVSQRVPHLGKVIIENDVQIGANVCIDRGVLESTVIGAYTKIDNLCHIAHNVCIGKRCYVVALSMIGGSAKIEDDVYVAPGAIVNSQINVGENSMVGMGAVVNRNVPNGKVVIGVPAKILRDNGKLDF